MFNRCICYKKVLEMCISNFLHKSVNNIFLLKPAAPPCGIIVASHYVHLLHCY